MLKGSPCAPPDELLAGRIRSRLGEIATALGTQKDWRVVDTDPTDSRLLAEAVLSSGRIQPFSLLVHAVEGRTALRCVSPIGAIRPQEDFARVDSRLKGVSMPVAAISSDRDQRYDLTVEASVLLPELALADLDRVRALIERVLDAADAAERALLPGKDAPLAEFEPQLEQEGAND